MLKIRTKKTHYKDIYEFCQNNMGDDRITAMHTGKDNSDDYEITIYPKPTRRAYEYTDGSLLVNCLICGNKVWGMSEKDNKKEYFETSPASFRKIIKQNNETEKYIYRPQTDTDVTNMLSRALPECIKDVQFDIILIK